MPENASKDGEEGVQKLDQNILAKFKKLGSSDQRYMQVNIILVEHYVISPGQLKMPLVACKILIVKLWAVFFVINALIFKCQFMMSNPPS